jgi:hypothetical protein
VTTTRFEAIQYGSQVHRTWSALSKKSTIFMENGVPHHQPPTNTQLPADLRIELVELRRQSKLLVAQGYGKRAAELEDFRVQLVREHRAQERRRRP